MSEELRRKVLDYLRGHHVLTLATVGPDGPAAASLFYACNDALNLYFLSDPASQHCVNLEANPRVAVTVHGDQSDWRQIQGVQLWGTAGQVTNPHELRHALATYTSRFPFVGEMMRSLSVLSPQGESSPELAGRLRAARLYRITPQRVRWIDNTMGFAHKEEFEP